MRDLTLLLGSFVKFRFFIVLQTAPENFQNLRSGFAGGANDKDAVEFLFVFAITCGEGRFDILARSPDFLLFRARPSGRPDRRGRRRMRIAYPRVTTKGFEPIGSRESCPNLIACSQQSCLIENWSASRHTARPGF